MISTERETNDPGYKTKNRYDCGDSVFEYISESRDKIMFYHIMNFKP